MSNARPEFWGVTIEVIPSGAYQDLLISFKLMREVHSPTDYSSVHPVIYNEKSITLQILWSRKKESNWYGGHVKWFDLSTQSARLATRLAKIGLSNPAAVLDAIRCKIVENPSDLFEDLYIPSKKTAAELLK